MPGEALYLASLCYGDAHNAVADWRHRYQLPLSPVLQTPTYFADREGVAREALVLAILLEHSAASFKTYYGCSSMGGGAVQEYGLRPGKA